MSSSPKGIRSVVPAECPGILLGERDGMVVPGSFLRNNHPLDEAADLTYLGLALMIYNIDLRQPC